MLYISLWKLWEVQRNKQHRCCNEENYNEHNLVFGKAYQLNYWPLSSGLIGSLYDMQSQTFPKFALPQKGCVILTANIALEVECRNERKFWKLWQWVLANDGWD